VSRFPVTLAGWKLRILLGSLALDSMAGRLGKLASLVVITGFSIGATLFFHAVFDNMLQYRDIGEPLLWRMIGITILTVFGLLVVSNLITGIATIFRSPETEFLFARPVSPGSIFLGRFTDNLVYSSWSLAVLGIPIIVAWGWQFDLSIWVIIGLVIFGLLPLVLISAELGSLLLMVFIFLTRKISPRMIVILALAASLGFIGWQITRQDRSLIVGGVARTSTVERYLAQLDQQSRSIITPAHWLTSSMRSIHQGNGRRALFLILFLSLTAIVWLRWIYLAAERIYYKSWIVFGETAGRGGNRLTSTIANRFTSGFIPNPMKSLLLKDILQFVRNPNQWAQFLILVAFLLIYLFNLLYVSSRFDFTNPYWKTLVLFLNFAFTGFILATLSVRFIFPLISLEGRGFWLVRSAPVSIGVLFWEKFFLAFLIFLGLCELIIYFSNQSLHVGHTMMILTTAAIFMMGATLTALAIGLGALLPDFRDESPMRIASTPGGVLTVVISLVYVSLMVAVLAWPARGYFVYLTGEGPFPAAKILQALALVTGLNALTFILPLRLGRRSIQVMDL